MKAATACHISFTQRDNGFRHSHNLLSCGLIKGARQRSFPAVVNDLGFLGKIIYYLAKLSTQFVKVFRFTAHIDGDRNCKRRRGINDFRD